MDPFETDERVSDLEDDFIKVCQDLDDQIPGNKEKAEYYPGIYAEDGIAHFEACDADMAAPGPDEGVELDGVGNACKVARLKSFDKDNEGDPPTQNAIARARSWYESFMGSSN